MTPNIFFIGDTHFGHKNIIKFDATKASRSFASIEEHDEELVKRWNSVVRSNDAVWHLGDVAFGSKNLAICGRLNGTKRLVLGNHDTYPAMEYLKYFTRIFGAVSYFDMLLTHIPVAPQQFDRFTCNIHGHLHTNSIDDPRYVNVSAEQINLTPTSLEELRLRMPDRAKAA